MKSPAEVGRTGLLLAWSVVLTGLTVILGGAPLKAVRRQWGSIIYWLVCIGLSVLFVGLGQSLLGFSFLLVSCLVGLQTELELKAWKFPSSALTAVSVSGLLGLTIMLLWTKKLGPGWKELVEAEILKQMSLFGSTEVLKGLNVSEVLYQIPSLMFILLGFAMAMTFFMEKPVLKWSGVKTQSREKLRNFSLPDFLIWPFIVGLLFSFIQGGEVWMKPLGQNLLNVAVVAYFFQGLAVLYTYFEVFRVTTFWRVLLVFIFVVQLFLVLSFVGIIDYWVDLRSYMRKKATALKQKRSNL